MSHVPPAPRPVLDATGARIACPDGASVWLVDGADDPRRVRLAHAAEYVAWAPRGVVVAGERQLTHQGAGWSRPTADAASALTASAEAVAVGYSGEHARIELFAAADGDPAASLALPSGRLEGLRTAGDLLLVWGVDDETAEPVSFGRLLEPDGTVRWADDSTPVQDILWPLAEGTLGIVGRDTLTLVRPGHPGASTQPWDGLGLTASAPGGALAATLAARWDGTRDHQVVEVFRVPDGNRLLEVELPGVEQHAALAVDDAGRVTVASGSGTDRLRVETIAADGRVTTAEYRLAEPQPAGEG